LREEDAMPVQASRTALTTAILIAAGLALLAPAQAQQTPAQPAQPPAARPATPAPAAGATVDRPPDGTPAAPDAAAKDPAAKDSGVLGAPGDPPDDRHAGYYYPPVTSTETYVARVDILPDVDRAKRVGFATVISRGLLNAPYRPTYAVFAKGAKADRLIIVGMADGEMNTLYRIRAVLANLTTQSRLTQVFQENTVAENATFLDFLKMFGFRQVTVTDGVRITHQINIK
jgi:hypothetical protein